MSVAMDTEQGDEVLRINELRGCGDIQYTHTQSTVPARIIVSPHPLLLFQSHFLSSLSHSLSPSLLHTLSFTLYLAAGRRSFLDF